MLSEKAIELNTIKAIEPIFLTTYKHITKIIKTYTDRRLYCLKKEKDSRFSLLPKISMILYINTGRMRLQ